MSQIQPLSQMDPRWKENKLGQDQNATIGKYGCLLTSMAMVANAFGNNETPASLNDKMKAVGGFQGALIIPALAPNALPGLKYLKYIKCHNQLAPMGEIDATLVAGRAVIVEVDYSPAAGMQNHWLVLYGKKGDDYLLRDPWPYPAEAKEVLLTSRYGFAGTPAKIITGAIWYDGTPKGQPPVQPPQPKPIPAAGFAVYASADALALRRQPFVAADNLIKRVTAQTKLFVLEPEAAARQKIGQFNQWLQVQEAGEGYEGYVAAWYVAAASQPVPTPAPVPAPPQKPSGLVVYASEEALALRTQPVISDATLIKRVPLNAEFSVLDAADQARQKIGGQNQWLKVRDIEGDEGYVAAWFVSLTRKEPALGPQEGPKPAPLVLTVIENGLALRTQPVISPATLIKRLPLQAELIGLEQPAQLEAKLGVMGQWVKVRDIHSIEGYVAAWYVVKRN